MTRADSPDYDFDDFADDFNFPEESSSTGDGFLEESDPLNGINAIMDAIQGLDAANYPDLISENQPLKPVNRPLPRLDGQVLALIRRGSSQASTTPLFAEASARLSQGLQVSLGQVPARGLDQDWIDPHLASAVVLEDVFLVQTMARAATRARSELEAGLLSAAMVPVAMRRFQTAYRGLWAALPALVLGFEGLARWMYTQEPLRVRLALLPDLLYTTLAHLTGYLFRGQQITARLVTTILARQAVSIFGEKPIQAILPGSGPAWRAAPGADRPNPRNTPTRYPTQRRRGEG